MIELNYLPDVVRMDACIECPKNEITSLKQLEKTFLLNALRNNKWNKALTARQLGMHKTTLYRKIKSLGLDDE